MASTINAKNTSTGVVITPDASGQLELQTADTTRMTIDVNGNVGIGTSSPSHQLDIYNASGSILNISGEGATQVSILRASTDATGCATIQRKCRGTVASPAAVQANDTAGTTQYQAFAGTNYRQTAFIRSQVEAIVSDTNISGNLQFFTTNGGTTASERMRITSAGEVWIAGTTDQGAYNLQCNGTGVWGAGAYVNGSDARIKDDITPIDSGLDVVGKLNPVTYKYKEEWSKDQSVQTGFIAQELLVALEGKSYVDGIVQQGGEYMSVAYQNIIPILTKAIQELKAELDTVKAELAELKGAA